MSNQTTTRKPMWQRFMEACPEKDRAIYEAALKKCGPKPDWAMLQLAFEDTIDQYLDVEIQKPLGENIHMHEAGGQFRVAFPHQLVRARKDVYDYMQAMMEARKAFTDENQYHGYVDCHEVHHEIETYLYYQNPLVYYQFPGHETALSSVLDVAEHTGSWVADVPAWYNWENHGFVSVYLGTRGVKNFPPHDYQEANHFRFLDEAILAWLYTKEPRYMELVRDYCDRWCDHIEKGPEHGPITCQILPENVQSVEMNHAGVFQKAQEGTYQIFYATVAENTLFDIASTLMDVYAITGEGRYLAAAEKMMDQFYFNGNGVRPATSFAGGEWRIAGMKPRTPDPKADPNAPEIDIRRFSSGGGFLPRLAVRHTMRTGSLKYKEAILRWAADIDENTNKYDQMTAALFVAAHFYDGSARWLERAYQMALRYSATTEGDDQFHQCAAFTRQGSKYGVDVLYTPILGDPTFANRGEVAMPMFRYCVDGKDGLGGSIAVRVWYKSQNEYYFEVKNKSAQDAQIQVRMGDGRKVDVDVYGKVDEGILLAPGFASVSGIFKIKA